MAQKAPVRILITGAAGQIAYSLIFSIAKGDFLGKDQPVILHLLDIEPMLGVLNGVVMEIEDGAFELLRGVVPTTDPNVAFQDVDYVLMVGAMPRKAGMERKDLLKANAGIFKVQGKALNERAKKDVRVLVVGNPANTNCLIMCKNAPDIPKTSFSALTRLDHNRAKAQIAMRLGTNPKNVKNVAIWGNHSATQYPDVSHGVVMNFPKDGMQTPIEQAVNDEAWLHGDFIKTIQQRGAAVIKARQLSSAASAAKAIVDHMRDWIVGTAEGEWVSMGLYTDGKHYGIPEGLIFSFPVTCKDRQYKVVEGLSISPFSQTMLNATLQELQGEEGDAKEFFA